MILLALLACTSPDDTGHDTAPPDAERVHPTLAVTADMRDVLAARLDDPRFAPVAERIRELAARETFEAPSEAWDHQSNGRNAETAQAAALLAWLEDDEDAARRAVELLDALPVDYETNTVWDVNIRMPHTLMGFTNAVDLLLGTPWYTEEQARAHADKLTTITDAFFDAFLEDEGTRRLTLGTTQNNHPIRTATAIGYVALAFPDHPRAETWTNWAVSELDYLWGAGGHYVQPDGGVSEGPFYFGFAWGVSAAFFVAMNNAADPDHVYARDCRNRTDADPWTDHGCVDGEPFTFDNPIHGGPFVDAAAWSLSLRLPSGHRPPLADAYMNPFNGGALLTSFGGDGTFAWDWIHNADRPYEMHHGADLTLHHLAWVDPDVAPVEPDYRNRFLPEAGNAVFRSGWDEDARWLLLVAEEGSVRKTVHDHVDSTSFSMAAYGEYLLVDPGYYKPNSLDNARTSSPQAHNVVLIDGEGAPPKGLLTDFGDTDAYLENTVDGDAIAYAEARQAYRDTEFVRSVAFVDGRYFVVADRLTTTHDAPRTHQWRLGGYAGKDVGGTFTVRDDGARWEREAAGVDVFLAATAPGLEVVEPPFVEGEAPHVHKLALNRETSHHGVIDGVVDGLAPRFLAVLAPYRVTDEQVDADGPMQVAPVDVPDGVAAWEVHHDGMVDLVILRDPDATEVVGDVSTDAELVLVRDGVLRLAAGGSYVEVGGARTEVTGAVFVAQ